MGSNLVGESGLFIVEEKVVVFDCGGILYFFVFDDIKVFVFFGWGVGLKVLWVDVDLFVDVVDVVDGVVGVGVGDD